MSEQRIEASDLAPFRADQDYRCSACAWPVLTYKYIPPRTVDAGEGVTETEPEYLLRTCERCGRMINMQLTPGNVTEHGAPLGEAPAE